MSSILKGLMRETNPASAEKEKVHVVYIDGKPSTKYMNRVDAGRAIKRMREKFPEKKFEIKQEMCEDEFFVRHNDNNRPEPMQFRIKGGAGSYTLENLKKKAVGEAKQLVADLEAGKFVPSAYNIKQLANTIETVADVLRELDSKSKQDNFNYDLDESFNNDDSALEKRITARKYEGNDQHSYAVLVDGKPVVTGLGKAEVSYYKKLALKILKEKSEIKEAPDSPVGTQPGGWRTNRGKSAGENHSSGKDVSEQKVGSGRFAAEKTASTNPYAGRKERQVRGSIGEGRKTSSHVMQDLTNPQKK